MCAEESVDMVLVVRAWYWLSGHGTGCQAMHTVHIMATFMPVWQYRFSSSVGGSLALLSPLKSLLNSEV